MSLKKLLMELPEDVIMECAKDSSDQKTSKEYYKKILDEYKEFSGWNIKYEMMRDAKSTLTSSGIKVGTLFDLASGRGNDLNRWLSLKIPNVVGLEFDPKQMKMAIDRYRKNRRKKEIRVSYFQGSAIDYDRIREVIKHEQVSLISNNFAANYFFETKKTGDSFLKAVSDSLIEGGIFIGTAADGDVIEMLYKLTGSSEMDTDLYYIKKDPKIKNKYKFRINTPYFDEYTAEEFILKKQRLVDDAKKFNMVPYAITPGVPAIFNFLQQPLVKSVITKKYYQRPVGIASLYFGFSFIKASKRLLNNIENPKPIIIIPYRNRKKDLNELFETLPDDIDVLVAKQSGSKKSKESEIQEEPFNRGLLINTAVAALRNSDYNYYIIHDVDLIPDDDLLDYYYTYPINPIHLGHYGQRYSQNSENIFKTKYADKQSHFLGGILSINKDDYEKINGFPNNFKGWGGEDDALRNRLSKNHIAYVVPPVGSVTDLEDLTIREKLDLLKKSNTMIKTDVKKQLVSKDRTDWLKNGLRQTKVQKLKEKDMASRTVLTIKI
jgi:hypothetical protein